SIEHPMQCFVDRLRMRHAAGHRESYCADRTHIREHPAYITPIAQKLVRVLHFVGAVKEVVDPMGGVSQERLGLNFVPSIFRYDSQDKRVKLDVMIGMDRARRSAEVNQGRLGKKILKLDFTSSDRCDDASRARNRLVEPFEWRPNVFFFVYGVSLDIHFSLRPRA